MTTKKKKIPVRMCIGCQEMKPKKELIRIVKSPEGIISLDLTGKKPGRGAYICFSIDCLEKIRKGRKLDRTFAQAVENEVYDILREELEKVNDQ